MLSDIVHGMFRMIFCSKRRKSIYSFLLFLYHRNVVSQMDNWRILEPCKKTICANKWVIRRSRRTRTRGSRRKSVQY